MKSYKVISGRIAGKKAGEVVTEAELLGANIKALVDGSHIEQVSNKKEPKESETTWQS